MNGRKNEYANDHSSVTELLWGLHWLPIKACVLYKTVLPAFQILNTGTSPYLTTLHTRKSFCIVTRTSEKLNIIKVPTDGKGRHSKKSFSIAGPPIWNELLTDEQASSPDITTVSSTLYNRT